MWDRVVGSASARGRVLNAVALQNAVLCAECDVVSDSPHNECLVCGSRSLFNISRMLGGNLPKERVWLPSSRSKHRRAKTCWNSPTLTGREGGRRAHFTSLPWPMIRKLMNRPVQCWSGRKADERPIRFYLKARQYQFELCSIGRTTERASLTRFVPTTAISTSCDKRHRRQTGLGSWSRFAGSIGSRGVGT